MSKDINSLLQDATKYTDYQKQQEQIDPNLFVNDVIRNDIKESHFDSQVSSLLATTFLSLFTAPFTTTHVSLQLSVIPHQNKYGNAVQSDLTALTKAQTQITVQDRRKFQLMIQSGVTGSNQPFRAPVYGSYGEVLKGLASQGLLGFYQGNLTGIALQTANSSLRFNLMDMLNYDAFKFHHTWSPTLKWFSIALCCSLVDIVTHPIMTVQSRFILQNRLPNFSLYKSYQAFFKKHYRRIPEIMQGWKAHIPRNIIMILCWNNFLKDRPREGFVLSNLLSCTFTYPLMTATRRLQCQSTLAGMIPIRYSGVYHCMLLMFQEEGLKGLYRGFMAYMVAQGMSLSLLMQFSNQSAEMDA